MLASTVSVTRSPGWDGMLNFCMVVVPSFRRLLKGGAIREGPGHLGDPAVLAVALGAAGRVYLGVPVHQSDLDDGGSGGKLKRDDLAYAITVAAPCSIQSPVGQLFRRVVDRLTGAVGGLRRLATDLHLSRRRQATCPEGVTSEGAVLSALVPEPGPAVSRPDCNSNAIPVTLRR